MRKLTAILLSVAENKTDLGIFPPKIGCYLENGSLLEKWAATFLRGHSCPWLRRLRN
jgi:hypothetical protein